MAAAVSSMRGDSFADLVLIAGAVADERRERIAERIAERIEECPGLRAVFAVSPRQRDGDDLAAAAVNAEMQLAPGAPPGGAGLLDPARRLNGATDRLPP